jgi:hypothetical protein
MENHSLVTFQQHLTLFESLLAKASKQKNPTIWLYKNNARTTLFMLESLARLFKTLHNKKRFTKMQDIFKRLEDGLGAIDFYENILAYCKTNKAVPKNIVSYLQEVNDSNCDALNSYIADVFFENNKTMSTMKQKLESADWQDETQTSNAIEKYYAAQILKINIWWKEHPKGMETMEEGVHELRRKLRWLSILPQALNGKIQLDTTVKKTASIEKYLTKEVIKSPFNKLPTKGKLQSVAMLNQHAFLAISWMIAELGNIKDQGQTQEELANIYAAVHLQKPESSKLITDKYIDGLIPIKVLLQQANKIATTFFKEKILESL